MKRRGAVLDDRGAVLGSRVADVAVEAEVGVGRGDRGACSGRGSPSRSPRRRRSRRCGRRRRSPPGARPRQLGTRKPSVRQAAPGTATRSRLRASASRLVTCRPARVDPANAADRHGDPGGGAHDHRVERLALLGAYAAWSRRGRRARGGRACSAARSRAAPRRRPAARPASRGRPRRRRRRSGSRARGRTETASPPCAGGASRPPRTACEA